MSERNNQDPDCPIGRANSAHPKLRSILSDEALFRPHHPGGIHHYVHDCSGHLMSKYEKEAAL